MATGTEVPAGGDVLPIVGEKTETRKAYLQEMEMNALGGASARGLILRDLRDLKAALEGYTALRDQGPRQQALAELEELQAQISGESPTDAS